MGIRTLSGWRFRTIAAAIALLSGAWNLPAPAQPPATPPTMALPEVHERLVRWQTLPPEIRFVFISPDQRRWYVANDGNTPVALSQAKAEIEQQWKAPGPVLRGSCPALFEKTGRAWFISADSRTLLAYDGTTWIEHATHAAADSPRGFIGEALGRSRVLSVPSNVDLGSVLLFPEWSGISTFDGTNWTYQPTSQKLTAAGIARCMLMVESDGKSTVVFREGAREAWRFHDRQWTPLPIPDAVKDPINSIALGLDGTLLVETRAGGIFSMSLASSSAAPAASIDKTFEKYLNKIDSPDPAIAQVSMDGMVSLGPQAIPLVQKILENVVDSDAEARLREVLRRLNQQKRPSVRPKFMVGDVDVGPLMPGDIQPRAGNPRGHRAEPARHQFPGSQRHIIHARRRHPSNRALPILHQYPLTRRRAGLLRRRQNPLAACRRSHPRRFRHDSPGHRTLCPTSFHSDSSHCGRRHRLSRGLSRSQCRSRIHRYELRVAGAACRLPPRCSRGSAHPESRLSPVTRKQRHA